MSAAILLILILVTGGINWFGNRSVMHKAELAYMLKNGTMHLQGMFRGINEFIIDEGGPLSVKLTRKHLSAYDELHTVLSGISEDPSMRQAYQEKVTPQWEMVRAGLEDFLKISMINATNEEAVLQYGRLATKANILHKEVEALAEKIQEDAQATAKKIKSLVSIMAAVIMAIMCFILLSLYRSITSLIRDLNTIAEGFEKGDLSITMNEARKGEFGRLAVNFNHALRNLNAFIGRLTEDINSVAVSAERFSEDAARIVSDTQKQSAQTAQAAAATEELSATFTDIVQNTESVSMSADNAFNLAVESGEVVIEAMNCMNTIAEAVKDAAAIVEGLSHRSSQIGDIIEVINEIADQTNLLALNAAIESARAGEQGRGFSVVANEVKKLADRTSSATKEIADMINGIRKDTGKAVESMHFCTRQVSESSGFSEKAGNSLQMIVVSSQNVTEMIRRIAASVEEQSRAAGEITLNLSEIANITQHACESAQQSSESGRRLSEMAMELRGFAGEFGMKNGVDADHMQSLRQEITGGQPSVV